MQFSCATINGRVHTGGKRAKFSATIENDCLVITSNVGEHPFSARIANLLTRSASAEVVIEGTRIQTSIARYDTDDLITIRLDASGDDEEEFAWFWLVVTCRIGTQ